MAFPATTYTNEITALSALENKVAALGGGATSLGNIGFVTAYLANLLDNPVFLGGVGYQPGGGAGGAVTQATSKSTTVVLNTFSGAITMNAAGLATVTTVGFTLTNSQIAAVDVVLVSIKSGATANSYSVMVGAVAAGSCLIELRNNSGGTLSEAVVLNFAVIKGAAT